MMPPYPDSPQRKPMLPSIPSDPRGADAKKAQAGWKSGDDICVACTYFNEGTCSRWGFETGPEDWCKSYQSIEATLAGILAEPEGEDATVPPSV